MNLKIKIKKKYDISSCSMFSTNGKKILKNVESIKSALNSVFYLANIHVDIQCDKYMYEVMYVAEVMSSLLYNSCDVEKKLHSLSSFHITDFEIVQYNLDYSYFKDFDDSGFDYNCYNTGI